MDDELRDISDLIDLKITPETINLFCNKFESYIKSNKKFEEKSSFLLGINGIQKVSCYRKMNQKHLDLRKGKISFYMKLLVHQSMLK